MKHYIIYTWISILSLINFGCSDFLEEFSKDQVYAASCDDLDEVLIGNGYMKSADPWRYSISMTSSVYYPELFILDDDVDELVAIKESSLNYNSCIVKLRNFYTWQQNPFVNANAAMTEIKDDTFETLYQHIAYVNTIVSYVDQFPDDPIEDRKRIRGEGQFLRGAYYLMLNNLYGEAYDTQNPNAVGVPLNTTEYIEDKYFSRSSVKETYDVIVKDLKSACENLRGVVQKNFYRTNQLATRILLSRVYLYMEDYKNVITQCDSALLLGCPLKDLNTFNWTSNPKTREYILDNTNPEIVFTMGSTITATLFNEARTEDYFNSAYCTSDELMQLFQQNDIEDLRWKYYFNEHARARGKYVQRKTKDIYLSGNIPPSVFEAFVLRTVEIYLNKAEAQAMTGDLAGAIASLQPILDTRYTSEKHPDLHTMNEEQLVNFIRDERRRELCFEGHRWPDLRRYAVNTKYPLKKEINHVIYSPNNVTGGTYAGYFTLKPYGEDGGWVLPYPSSEIIYNNGSLVNPDRPERENSDPNFRTK